EDAAARLRALIPDAVAVRAWYQQIDQAGVDQGRVLVMDVAYTDDTFSGSVTADGTVGVFHTYDGDPYHVPPVGTLSDRLPSSVRTMPVRRDSPCAARCVRVRSSRPREHRPRRHRKASRTRAGPDSEPGEAEPPPGLAPGGGTSQDRS